MKQSRNIMCQLLFFMTVLLIGMVETASAGIRTEVLLNRSIILNLKKPVERVTLANPGFADVMAISPNQLQINGLSIGLTTLIVWEEGGKQPIFYDLMVKGDQSCIEELIKDIAPGEGINVQYANDTVVLSGKAAKEQTKAKVEKIAQTCAPKVLNYIQIDEPKQVLLEVKVAQVDKTSMKKLGLSFLVKGRTGEGFSNTIGVPTGSATGNTISSGISGTTTSQGSGTGVSGNVAGLGSYSPLDAFQAGVSYFPGGVGAVLQALATKGYAKVLAEPNLLVKSGQEGNFLAGSRIPYNVIVYTGGAATPTIVFQEVGVKLKFKPEVQENGLISLKIDPAEVSSITGTLAVNGYPIVDTRSVQTNVELKDGESLVMAGLLQEEAIKTMSKIPLLGDIPILGALFRSTENDIKEKELVFFITTKILKSSTSEAKKESLIENKMSAEEEKELGWVPGL